eukprot:4857297-Pyramimonas_sp.AAC.1
MSAAYGTHHSIHCWKLLPTALVPGEGSQVRDHAPMRSARWARRTPSASPRALRGDSAFCST